VVTEKDPLVSIIMPVRNEEQYIHRSLSSVLSQDYPQERMEVIITDGMSTDNTREIIEDLIKLHTNVEIHNNPGKIVPTGLNIALQNARGDVIIRVDGHCEIAPDYVQCCVNHLCNGVDGVGGATVTIGETWLAQAIAIAMSTPFGVGNSAFRTVSNITMLTDSVPFPGYTYEIMKKAGLYDEELIRNQDDEYNYRLRKIGAKILLAENLVSKYINMGAGRFECCKNILSR